MKILHISVYPQKNSRHVNDSGVAAYTKNLVLNTPYLKEDKVYIVCNKLNNKSEKYSEDGVTILRTFDRDIRFLFQILKEVYSIKPDVIHIQQELSLYGNIFTAYLLQWLLVFLYKFKTILTIHGVVNLNEINEKFIRENNSKLPVFLVKFAFFVIFYPLCILSKRVIVHEEIFKKRLVNNYKAPKNKVFVVPLGIEYNEIIGQIQARDFLSIDKSKSIILFMGYLTGYKGIELLIEGFCKYLKENKNSLLIIGAGKHPKLTTDVNYLIEYNRIKDKAQELLGENHKWIGFIKEEEVKYYYCASDVSIFPYTNHLSSSGPMGISVSFEIPFLASDVFSDFIEDEKMLFKKSPNDLSNSLKYFFENRNLFKEFIKNFKKNRSCKVIGEHTYSMYKSLI